MRSESESDYQAERKVFRAPPEVKKIALGVALLEDKVVLLGIAVGVSIAR